MSDEGTAIESLRTLYGELIAEAGHRLPDASATELAILPRCPPLLQADTEPAVAAVQQAVTEATTALAWLREQGVAKTEDGVKFPAAAYAYVPDPEKPNTWKLPIWENPEKKVTRKQLGAASAALSPGGFRGNRVQIPEADLPAVKRKIRAEYRKLGVEREDMPRWVKEADVRRLLRDTIPMTEATVDGKGIATIVVIRPGFNSSKDRYYSAEMLARDVGMFEGVKMFANHSTEDEDAQRPERDIRDWVATLQHAHIGPDGEVLAEAVIVEPWLKAKLSELRDKNLLGEMGISIDAVGQGEEGEIEGAKTAIIEKIVKVRSVDFVTYPGAGGIVTMYETAHEHDVDLMSIDQLRERRPDLVKVIADEAKALALKEAQKMSEIEDRVKELETDLETRTTELQTATEALEAAKVEAAKADAKSLIDKAIAEAELPAAAKTRLTERFANAENAEGIAEAITAEIAYIGELSESGKVKGMGASQPDAEADKAALRESAKRLHPEWTDGQIDRFVTGR